jgi:CO dehydrogenase maturation factor
MEHLSRRTTNDVDFLIAVANPSIPSLRAVKRIMQLSRELPINIHRRMTLVNRVAPDSPLDVVEREMGSVEAERLPDVPNDDDVERAGAVGDDIFSLDDQNPALLAVRAIVDKLCVKET